MVNYKKIKLDFESSKKIEDLNTLVIDLFNNPNFDKGQECILYLAKCLGIEPVNSNNKFAFILNSKFKKNAGWFNNHVIIKDSKAGEYIKHDNRYPIDINVF